MKITGQQIEQFLGGGSSWTNTTNVPSEISGFNIDTRKILPGEIFVALKTATRDGHDFLNVAAERGASGALVSHVSDHILLPQIAVTDPIEALQRIARGWRENIAGTVVGVTGSVGKTSTKDLLNSIFSACGKTRATVANLNNTIGVPLTILAAESFENLIVEAGMSIPGELERSAWVIEPDVAVITNVKPAHLEGLGSMENIAREKSAMARHISTQGISVFPADLLRYADFRNLRSRRIVIARNQEEEKKIEAAQSEENGESLELISAYISERGDGFEIELNKGEFGKFFMPGASKGLAENAALAIVAAERSGVATNEISDALAAWKPSAGRGELRLLPDGRHFYVDCYNASPASILDSTSAFVRRTSNATQRLFVLGGVNELGADSEKLHRFVGENLPLSAGTDTLAVFGGNSKYYVEGAVSKGFPHNRTFVFDDIEDLRKFVATFRGDIMVKGSRGFALERVIPE